MFAQIKNKRGGYKFKKFDILYASVKEYALRLVDDIKSREPSDNVVVLWKIKLVENCIEEDEWR